MSEISNSLNSDDASINDEILDSDSSIDDSESSYNSINDMMNVSFDEISKPLTADKLAKHSSKIDASGVVYLSKIPPFMKPPKLRSLISQYGKLGRLYLAPEDSKSAAKRKKYKKNKRINYIEGWVEFLDKKEARACAELINGVKIGGKKRSYYHDDIWNIKYLPRFKWNHLTEQIAYELKAREHKIKTELSQAKRENKLYVKNVEKAKMIDNIISKKASNKPTVERKFKQRKVIQEQNQETKSLLTKLFKH